MALPMSFDDVSYFKGTYVGDLIITDGVIYYFPNTKLTAQTNKNLSGWNRVSLLFLLWDLANILGDLGSEIRASINKPLIKQDGLWRDDDSSEALQRRLDAHIAELKKCPEDQRISLRRSRLP